MSENKMDALVQKVADALVYAKDTTRLETAVLLNVAELDAIRSALQPQPEPVAPDKWVIAKETVSDTGDPRPELGYTVIPDFPLFDTDVAAIDAIKQVGLPIGWVILKLSQLLPNLSLSPAPKPQGEPVACDCECTTQEERDRCPWTPVCDQAKAAAPPTPAADVAPERVSLPRDWTIADVQEIVEELKVATRSAFLAGDYSNGERDRQFIHRAAVCAWQFLEVLLDDATPAASAGAVAQEETALQQYRRFAGTEPSTPLEDLRFFLSCALKGQDWLDVEPFLDALPAAPAEPAAGDVVPRAQYSESVRKWRDTFESMHQRAMRAERALADRESRIAALEGERERERAKLAAVTAERDGRPTFDMIEAALEQLSQSMLTSCQVGPSTVPGLLTIFKRNIESRVRSALSVASHDAAPTTAAGG